MTVGAAVLTLLAASPAPAPQMPVQLKAPPVFSAQVDNVYVDAFVSDRREPVNGLTAADFELRDNGVVQQVELVSTEAQPLLAVLVFDSSGSLGGERLDALRAAGHAFLETLRPQDEVSLFTFSDETEWSARPTTDKSVVAAALDRLKPIGATSVLDALYAALTLPQSRSRTLIVLFTDGEDNMSWLDWRQMRLVAERSNALIHVVGLQRPDEGGLSVPPVDGIVGRMTPIMGTPPVEWLHSWGLRQIADAAGGRYWAAESSARLKAAFAAITEAMAQRYVLTYEPEGVKRPGWHEIEMRLRNRKGEVHARRGYWVADR